MNRTTCLLIAVALLSSWSAALFASGQEVEIRPLEGSGARQALERFAHNLDSLHARFSQRVISTDGFVEDESEGEVWLQKYPAQEQGRANGGYFRWAYYGEFPELIVADGEKVWIYDEALEQVTVRDQSDAADDNPLVLLTDLAMLDRHFEVRELGEIDGMHLLELRSRDENSEFERVLLGLIDGRLDLLAMEDAFDLRTEIRFSDVSRNLPLEADLFRFTPPDGVDVIGGDVLVDPGLFHSDPGDNPGR
jgi:outer membrane lipoprotein carrier protein